VRSGCGDNWLKKERQTTTGPPEYKETVLTSAANSIKRETKLTSA
jgi:hypothetical protein